ncbi:MAG: SGNH/GDSL hydrolase family protein, partial [Thermodesulfobacteriota bacterium]
MTSKVTYFKVLATVLLIILLAFFGEVVIRFTGAAPEVGLASIGRFRLSPNPLIGYELKPNLAVDKVALYADFADKTNSLGFRDVEHKIEKKEGVFRILVLGDSITQGFYIKEKKDIFTSVMERELRRSAVVAEVINFGVSGYNTQQEVYTLKEKGLAFKPDLVVVAFCLNDIEQKDGGIMKSLIEKQKKSNLPVVAPYGLLLKSALYRFLYYRIYKPLAGDAETDTLGSYDNLKETTVKKSLTLLGELSKENSFDVMVAVFPMFPVHPTKNKFSQNHRVIGETSKKLGFLHLDLL